MQKTLILGATPNPERYAFKAAEMLTRYGHEIIPIGIKKGIVSGKEIINNKEIIPDIETVTLYLGLENQVEWYDYILATRPKRIIFNPGTENPTFAAIAQKQGIETIEACTLVLLSTGQY